MGRSKAHALLLSLLTLGGLSLIPVSAQSGGQWNGGRLLDVYYATTRFNDSPSGRPLYSGARHLDIGLGQNSTEFGLINFQAFPGTAPISSSPNWDVLRNEMSNRDTYWKQAQLGRIDRYSESDFFNRVRNFHGLICIYVHGYDMTFDEASREMGELADELQRRSSVPVMPVLFTWPSPGNKADYAGDEASLEWSEKYFRRFVNRLADNKTADTSIDLVAHSMGSRLAYWYAIAEGTHLNAPPFRNIFLSCADTDYDTAETRKEDLEKCVSNMVYVLTNDDDGPLLTSALLHVQPRLGRPLDSGLSTGLASGLTSTSQGLLNKQRLASSASSLISANGQSLLNSVQNMLASRINTGSSTGSGSASGSSSSSNDNSLARLAVNALLNKNGNSPSSLLAAAPQAQSADVRQWVAVNPALGREYGYKSRFIDDTGLVTLNSGHRIAWPLLAGLMQPTPTLSPFITAPVYKKPHSLLLTEMGGTPSFLYRFSKIDLNQLAP